MLRGISILILVIISSGLFAQVPDTLTRPVTVSDTLKGPRILKEWTLSPDFTEEVAIPFDTVFSLFHRYRLTDKYSPVNATLGNYGLPFYQLNFFDRINDPDKFLYANYYPVMWIPERAMFMNTQVPFTELSWTFAGPRQTSEQTFRIKHSQNVNRFLNFGLIYDIIYSLGQYNYQRADDKNFTLFSSYTGDKYKMYFSAGINTITSFENGGIADLSQLGVQSNTRDVQVNMGEPNTAANLIKNRSLLLVQRYTIGYKPSAATDSTGLKKGGFFGLSGTFSHLLAIEGNKRTYSDNSAASGFYDTVFIIRPGVLSTFDSLSSRFIKNTVRFDFTTDESRKFRLGGGVGIRNELFRYSQIVPTFDTATYADTVVWRRSNNALVGKLFNNIGDKFRWVVNGELFLSGYRAGDFNANGAITKSFDFKKGRASWIINGGLSNRQPSFWFQQWSSNHFVWNTNLKKEFRINLGTNFSYPARKADLKFNYTIIDNYTDFDTTAHPSQHSGGLSVAAVTISKELRAWKFHLAGDVIIQQSSNRQVLDLPFVTFRSAGYFEHLFRFASTGGSLNTQLGADVTYHTGYHPYAYMPATGRFYRQDLITTGNYPFINIFLNLKVQRTRIFVMFDHVNAGLMGYDYVMIPSYPMNVRMLRYGIAWTFYD